MKKTIVIAALFASVVATRAHAFTEAVHAYLGLEAAKRFEQTPTGNRFVIPLATPRPGFAITDTNALLLTDDLGRSSLFAVSRAEFQRYYLAGAIGPDVFPDLIVGPAITHADWSASANHPKAWEWASEVAMAPQSTYSERAAAAWDLKRPYWGTTYRTKDELKFRFDQESRAFVSGYFAHFAHDAVANEMVNAFSGGAFSWENQLRGLFTGDRRTEARHKAINLYVEQKLSPWIANDMRTLVDLRAPIPVLREILIRGNTAARAPMAFHLGLFNKFADFYRTAFSCKAPTFDEKQCDNKKPPAVYQFLDCIDREDRVACVRDVLCYFVKNAFGHQEGRLRDAMDAWLLLSMAVASYKIESAAPIGAKPIAIVERFKQNISSYGFRDAILRSQHQKFTGDSFAQQLADALLLFVQQFVLPAAVPATVAYERNGDLTPTIDPELLRQVELSCKYMGYTNLVAVCEFAVDLIKSLVRQIAERLREEFRQFLWDLVRKAGGTPPESASRPLSSTESGSSSGTASTGPAGATAQPATVVFKVDTTVTPDVMLNRLYPCATGEPCAAGSFGFTKHPERPIAREIKRRLDRFVGIDRVKGLLATDWAACRGLTDWDDVYTKRPYVTGTARDKCLAAKISAAIKSNRLKADETPVLLSQWLKRALNLSIVFPLSHGDRTRLIRAAGTFATRDACAAKFARQMPLVNGVLASLHGTNARGYKLENRHFDELAAGNFALYDPACKPLYDLIIPEIPDSDGDGVNDIYDTCPDNRCATVSPNPWQSHVGGGCLGPSTPIQDPNARRLSPGGAAAGLGRGGAGLRVSSLPARTNLPPCLAPGD
ncbi:MAG: hypothetical protein HYY84_05920 [Deltaproteobacteria bacterium]|nr:hypothetical protein [Deltaproteobacteria bacterium]